MLTSVTFLMPPTTMVWYLRTSWSLRRIANLKLLLHVILNDFFFFQAEIPLKKFNYYVPQREAFDEKILRGVSTPTSIFLQHHFGKKSFCWVNHKIFGSYLIFQTWIPFMNLQYAQMELVCCLQIFGKIVNHLRPEVEVFLIFILPLIEDFIVLKIKRLNVHHLFMV